MKKQAIVVGIDMGATHTRLCLMNLQQQPLITQKHRTAEIMGENPLQGLIEFIQRYTEDYIICHILIGLPATLSKNRKQILSAPNLQRLPKALMGLIPHLSQHFSCTVQLERDVNLQLIYDIHHFNLQTQSVLGFYLGTGIGFASYQQNSIMLGQHGVAGELGHIPYGDPTKQCQCGNYGCLETLCSGRALKKWYDSSPRTFPFEQIFHYQADNLFIQSFLHSLVQAIAMAINLFDPNAVILGGGVIDMPDFPFAQVKQDCLSMIRQPLPYEALTFYQAQSSDFNGAMGAALQAINNSTDKATEKHLAKLGKDNIPTNR